MFYPFGFEIAGDLAMFADPASGSEGTSLPFPPPSACVGIIDSIYRVLGVKIGIIATATCSLPNWTKYGYNSRSPFRKYDTIKKDKACQIKENVLVSPRFQILAYSANIPGAKRPPQWQNNRNPAHALKEAFLRRLNKGQSFKCPSLGRKEFLCTYLGPIASRVETQYTTVIPSMLASMWDGSKMSPKFQTNVLIKSGILEWVPNIATLNSEGQLSFKSEAFN